MIGKETFIKHMGYIKQTMDKEDKVYEFVGKTFRDSFCLIYSDEITHMIEMVCDSMELERKHNDLFNNDVEYFIYDLEWGKNWTPESVTEADGTPVDLSTVEKLYDYLVQCKGGKND